ncbi:MAG: cell division protein FtsZ [Anaerolineales bacterium]|nr:cell division protein FtsZ [Anaerolineales bacterium]MDD5466881.1 cell division protein FtsZ [Anaerolineales bacterium]
MDMNPTPPEQTYPPDERPTDAFTVRQPVIKVMGLGGGGCNAVGRMIEHGLSGVEFIAVNTDYQALRNSPAPVKVQLGPQVTRGNGAGGNPQIGREAARESATDIARALEGADMVFLTAGMGGGTGTGAIPVAAEIARNSGAVTIAVVTTPFGFEMGKRQRNTTEGLNALRPFTHTLITIPNERLLQVAPKDLPLEVAFRLADDVLRQAVQGISELITEPGLINVDFSHIRRIMMLGGGALMSIGHGQGQNKAKDAIIQALRHPLLDEVPLDHATGMIVNFTGGPDLTLMEVEEAVTYIQEQTHAQAEVVLGVINDPRMLGRTQAIMIITGMGAPTLEETLAEVQAPASRKLESGLPSAHPQPLLNPQMGEESFMPLLSAVNPNDLDVPAFLRKRARLAG